MKKHPLIAALVAALLGAHIAAAGQYEEQAKAWNQGVTKVNGRAVSTNTWAGTDAQALMAHIVSQRPEDITGPEAQFVNLRANPQLVNDATQGAAIEASLRHCLNSTNALVKAPAASGLIHRFAAEAEIQTLLPLVLTDTARLTGASAASRRLGKPAIFSQVCRDLKAKGMVHPEYHRWFKEKFLDGMTLAQQRNALRNELVALNRTVLDETGEQWRRDLRVTLFAVEEEIARGSQ